MGLEEKTPTSNPQAIYASGRASHDAVAEAPDLRLLHYNDVYRVDSASAEPVGGVARFMTLVKEYQEGEQFQGQPKLLTLFSGDAFNPSLERHMVPVLNAIGTDCACVGNHGFDFGVKQFRYLADRCRFPWLLANVLDPALGEDVPLGSAERTHMLTTSNGIKVGLIGLGERESLETIKSLPRNLIYKPASATAKELVPKLREQGAEIVICLSHMREPSDNKLAEQTAGIIDIILGGHDHYYSHIFVKGTHVLRSGTDFKQLSYVEARRKRDNSKRWDFDVWRRDVTSDVPEHEPSAKLVKNQLQKLLSRPIGWTAMPLDARSSTVRVRESNLGNFVCDVMQRYHNADCTIMASGTIRGDQIYPAGAIRIKDITTCFPFEDPVVLLRVKGQAIWDALENGVSTYPALESRFPQVSHIQFEFDPRRERGNRITSMLIRGRAYDPERKYLLATRGYMGRGKDGYVSLLVTSEGGEAEEIVDEENGIPISAMLRQYFMDLRTIGQRTIGQWKKPSDHWVGVAEEVDVPISPTRTREDEPDNNCSVLGLHKSPKNKDEAAGVTWRGFLRQLLGFLRQRLGFSKEPLDDDDHFDPHRENGEEGGDAEDKMDLEILLMRKFWTRWAVKAGVRASMGDPLKEGDYYTVDWTRVIAPCLEHRIRMVGST